MDENQPNLTPLRYHFVKGGIKKNHLRFFYPLEWMTFYDALKPQQKFTFSTLICTGARINEVRNIYCNDIDFINSRLTLRVTKCKAIKGEKSPTPRIIPISDVLKKRLFHHIKDHNLKSNDKIKILSTPAANQAMLKALAKTSIKDIHDFSVHNVRKTLETWLLAKGINSDILVGHFGHDQKTLQKHYVSPDTFTFKEKQLIGDIIGNLYASHYRY